MDKQTEDGLIETGQPEDKQAETGQTETKPTEEEILESTLAESLTELVAEKPSVSDDEFVDVVAGALEAVSGRLLFKMRIDNDGQDQHVAAASVGDGGSRQFLLLTLPASGGALKVETISKSANPVAGIAVAYAGLMDVFQAAA